MFYELKVRDGSESTYAADYKEMSALKSLADKLGITIIVIHHTRKMPDSDPFNQIAGSIGLSGCSDGSFVISETFRGSRIGTLCCVGRDIENAELSVKFDEAHNAHPRGRPVTDGIDTKPPYHLHECAE
jgi:hypothetical protein